MQKDFCLQEILLDYSEHSVSIVEEFQHIFFCIPSNITIETVGVSSIKLFSSFEEISRIIESYGPAMKKIKDHYFHKAKKEGYAARSVYKIEEIDKKYRIIRTGNKVLDLGCSPGSWLQYASRKVGNSGQVLGVDLQPVKISLPSHVKVIKADIFEVTDEDLKIKGGQADVILVTWPQKPAVYAQQTYIDLLS